MRITIFSAIIASMLLYANIAQSQCPTSGTISSNCTSTNLTVTGNTLIVNPGVTVTITNNLTIQGNATISASATSNIVIGGNFIDNWTSGGTNTISGGIYNISNNLVEASGGNFVINNARIYADSAYTSGGAHLQILNGSEVYITKGMWNSERLTIDASLLDIGGDLDATGGDNITVRNNGELIVRGDYKMNNGGGVQMNLENGGLVRVFGDVESNGGGNSIDADDDSAISVGGNFTGGSPPSVSVGTDDEDADCLSGGGCCGDVSACSSSSTLPVTLIDFNTRKDGSNVLLSWSTGTELNNDYFTIERSQNGVDFSNLAIISGSGTTSEIRKYSYVDKSLHTSQFVFYRLSQTDFDGTHEKLKIRVIETKSLLNEVKVYPNPLDKGGRIYVQGVSVNSTWVIYSLSGQSILNGVISSDSSIDSQNISLGTYLLVLNGDAANAKRIVIK